MRPDSRGEAKVAALPWGWRAELGQTPASAPLRLSARALDWLKWAALFTMVIDHANKIVFDGGLPWMTWIGRMAYPLFAFLIAYNLEVRGADWRKYAWRLGLAAAVSQPVYFYALAGNLNIFFTLLAGVLVWAAVGLAMLFMNGLLKSSLFALLALGLVWALSRVRFGEARTVRSRWATFGFYAFYPLHLLALALVGGWRV
ncbi:MAG: TraX family protein [Meiothermus sp.]|nr:TraX family protein [Meiothermus sp.]